MSAPSGTSANLAPLAVAWRTTLWCLTTAPSASAAALRSRCRLPPMADPRHAPSVFAAVHAAQWPSARRCAKRVTACHRRIQRRARFRAAHRRSVFARLISATSSFATSEAKYARYFATPAHALNTRAFRREGRNDETYRWSAYLAFLAAVARRRQIAKAPFARRCSSWRELHAASLHATAYARRSLSAFARQNASAFARDVAERFA